MSRFDLIIINATLVSASDISTCCIGILDERVHTIAASFTDEALANAEVIDAEGAFVMPGGVDGHVHLSQDLKTGPHGLGGECADDFETGSRSAVAGGTTTVITFATQTRAEEDRSLIKVVTNYKKRADATGSYADYGFHVIIVRNDADVLKEELPVLVKEWGITSCKLFMTYETQRLSDYQLLDVLLAAKQNGMTALIHAENGDAIEWLTDKLEARNMVAPYYHALSRPPVVEGEATDRAIALAGLIHSPILFVHVGSSLGMKNIRRAQGRGMPIYAETCPQYLTLTWNDLKRFHSPFCFENSKMICSPPPPPDTQEQEHLFTALGNGTCTIFSSDHCPFRYDHPHGKLAGVIEHEQQHSHPGASAGSSKQYPTGPELSELVTQNVGSFRYVPNGIPGVETRLPLLFSKALMSGHITPQKFVELTSTNPAKLYGLYPKKGTLMPGSDADIVIWHPQKQFQPFKLTNDHLHHNVDYTPYEGVELLNWPRYTILRGQVVWERGELKGKLGHGRYVRRGPSALKMTYPHHERSQSSFAWWLEGKDAENVGLG